MQISLEPAPSAPNEETGHHLPWGKILVGGTAFIVAILAIFIWPTFYYYDTITSGDKTYQVRTNRITGSMTYFEGGKWNNAPIPAAKLSISPRPADLAPPAQPPAISVQQPMPAPAITSGSAEGLKVAGEKEAPSEKQASQPAETKGYVIQVSAIRDWTVAQEFLETQKKSGQPVYLVKIKGKDRGVWYRIYIGHFADKAEAARYMKEKKIKEFFPECFIRKLSG
jgi:cell division septation protein DedD